MPQPLAPPAQGIGEGCVNGSTRGKIVEARENLRAKVLDKVLESLPHTRAALSWRQRDKVASSWILAIPVLDTSLSSAEFTEAAASYFCLPSPAASNLLGETIRGRVVVDAHGDNVQATVLPGDHWRARHNAFLHLIHRLCLWSGLPVQMEVFNLFSGLVEQPGLSRAEIGRTLQGTRPEDHIARGWYERWS